LCLLEAHLGIVTHLPANPAIRRTFA
jgi:hypothetical protein